MAVVEFQLEVLAPAERVFDLSRSVDLHVLSTSRTRERVVGGVASGLLGPGDDVSWEATHLWVRQRLSSRITLFDRPRHFRDSMLEGAFRRFDHDHFFEHRGPSTLVRERFDYAAPLGVIGRVAEVLVLQRYMRRFLLERARTVKAVAESAEWRKYLTDAPETLEPRAREPGARDTAD